MKCFSWYSRVRARTGELEDGSDEKASARLASTVLRRLLLNCFCFSFFFVAPFSFLFYYCFVRRVTATREVATAATAATAAQAKMDKNAKNTFRLPSYVCPYVQKKNAILWELFLRIIFFFFQVLALDFIFPSFHIRPERARPGRLLSLHARVRARVRLSTAPTARVKYVGVCECIFGFAVYIFILFNFCCVSIFSYGNWRKREKSQMKKKK